MPKIQLKQGLEANRTSIVPDVGEPIYTTDTKSIFIGDGVTHGGNSLVLSKADVGLENVDNTADIDKPVSTLQAEYLSSYMSDAEELTYKTELKAIDAPYFQKIVYPAKNSLNLVPLKLDLGNYFEVTLDSANTNFMPILGTYGNNEKDVISFSLDITYIGLTNPNINFWEGVKWDENTPPVFLSDDTKVCNYVFSFYSYVLNGIRFWRGFRII